MKTPTVHFKAVLNMMFPYGNKYMLLVKEKVKWSYHFDAKCSLVLPQNVYAMLETDI